MKGFATQEHPAVAAIPEVVGVTVVAVEPLLAVIVPLDVEDVEVAIRIGSVRNTTYATAL